MLNYEFPLNSKARVYLKFEKVFCNILKSCDNLDSEQNVMVIMRSIIDYMDLLDGWSSIKVELLKDLEKCDLKFRNWMTDPACNNELASKLRGQIAAAKTALESFTRQRTVLKDDPLIESVKPRFMTPSGVNCFDTPLFEYWIHLDAREKRKTIDAWRYELECIRLPIETLLELWRLCATYKSRTAKSGFMQESADNCDLISIKYDEKSEVYPVVSGFQSRISIRFLPYKKGFSVGDLNFQLSYIKASLS